MHEQQYQCDLYTLREQARSRNGAGSIEAHVNPAKIRADRQQRQRVEGKDRAFLTVEEGECDERKDASEERGTDNAGDKHRHHKIGYARAGLRNLSRTRVLQAAVGDGREIEQHGKAESYNAVPPDAELARYVDGCAEPDQTRKKLADA